MLELLRSASARRQLAIFSGLAALVLSVAHFILVYESSTLDSEWQTSLLITIGQITGGLIGGVLTAAYLLFISKYLFRQEDVISQVRCCEPGETSRLHNSAILDSETWLHNGHIGRWVRTRVIPDFCNISISQGTPRNVHFIILDPNNAELITRYSDYRDLIGFHEHDFTTIDDTRQEIITTLVRAALVNKHYPGMHISVHFKSTLDMTRTDIATNCAFRTLINPRSVAVQYLRTPSGHDFYRAVHYGFTQAQHDADEVPLINNMSRHPSRHEVRDYLDSVGVDYNKSDQFLDDVLKRLDSDYNPYS